LKNAKNHFIEAKIYKETEPSDTTTNSVLISTWLCVAFHLFEISPNTKPEEKKVWGAYYIPTV